MMSAAYLKNSFEAGVNESLDSFHSGNGGYPGLSAAKINTGFTMVLKTLILLLVPRSDVLRHSSAVGKLLLPCRCELLHQLLSPSVIYDVSEALHFIQCLT